MTFAFQPATGCKATSKWLKKDIRTKKKFCHAYRMKIEIEKIETGDADVLLENQDGGVFSFCFDDLDKAQKFSGELGALIQRYKPD